MSKRKFFFYTAALVICMYGQQGISQTQSGFVNFEYLEDNGQIHITLNRDQLEKEFLYVPSLSAGVGSNDIGLDRGQLGQEKVVIWKRLGDKIFLIEKNLDYRAVSNNELERKAVEEAFAQSTLGAFKIVEKEADTYTFDFTPFLIRDAHGVVKRLKRSKQGNYKLDKNRSAIWMDRTKAFPDNSEFEALLTFSGEAEGSYIRSVTPTPDAITVRQHHSFIRLPDSNYKPRAFHPFSGFNAISYYDYATPISQPLEKRWIVRHRLEKKNDQVEAVEPIIYYMDPGCPEPIRSALMEGARWWDQAYQAAGFAPNTFQVKDLPEGADMMDVRYNVIQWVHRRTRGWSYGASVVDPRTGEILKGHVSLGSLRVRQDFLIAQGILSPFGEDDSNYQVMQELALARLRQLAAHEVGHTIGLAHNFAASPSNRASVMDYPQPSIILNADGTIDMSDAYDTKIGDWDKQTIKYGYTDFGSNESSELNKIIIDGQQSGIRFISDRDARPLGGAHPAAHLWDNGKDIAEELNRMMLLRAAALDRMGESSITTGTPLSELEKVVVPVYLMHRYQVEATAKLIGGLEYDYFVKGDTYDHKIRPVDINIQGDAIQAVLNTLHADQLKFPEELLKLIPPPAFGYDRDRETFKGKTNLAFDPITAAESYVNAALGLMLHQDRLTRIHRQNYALGSPLELKEYLIRTADFIFEQQSTDKYSQALESLVKHNYIMHLIQLSTNDSGDQLVAAIISEVIQETIHKHLIRKDATTEHIKQLIDRAMKDPKSIQLPVYYDLPPGSPIGCGY